MQKLLGQEFMVKSFPRKSLHDVGRDPILFWGNKQIQLGNLPANLERLAPTPYCQTATKPELWRDFVTLACAMQML